MSSDTQATDTIGIKPQQETGGRRRGFLKTAVLATVGALMGRRSAEAAETAPAGGRLVAEGEPLKSSMYHGRPPVEPLDTMIRFERSDNHSDGRGMTHEVLSLIHEEKGTKSYPWTVYGHLTTHHIEGDACVVCSRLTKKGPGWSCGLHSEVYCHDRAVGLGVNVEMNNHYNGPERSEMIGVNINALGPYNSRYGMQIHDTSGHFDTAIGLNGSGKAGLDLGGKFDVGIHTHGNTIRVDEGTRIELDGKGQIALRYQNGRIEFLNGDKCIGHIDVNGEDHTL